MKDGQTLKDLYDERKVLFEKYADVTISEEGCQIEETIENVLNVIEDYSQNNILLHFAPQLSDSVLLPTDPVFSNDLFLCLCLYEKNFLP